MALRGMPNEQTLREPTGCTVIGVASMWSRFPEYAVIAGMTEEEVK